MELNTIPHNIDAVVSIGIISDYESIYFVKNILFLKITCKLDYN